MASFATIIIATKCASFGPNKAIDLETQQENRVNLDSMESEQMQNLQILNNNNQRLIEQLMMTQIKVGMLKQDQDRLKQKLHKRKKKITDDIMAGLCGGILLEFIIYYIYIST